MGHDIYGHKVSAQIAYLRRSMGSSGIHRFYTALDSEDYDNRVSGNGEYKKFDNEEIMEAIIKIKDDTELDDEDKDSFIAFLNKCLEEAKENPDGVLIYFG